MALLVMILRKMAKNKWLEFSLLIGLIVSVALASSMPIYTNAILQRMLVKDLEILQTNSGSYPGIVSTFVYLTPELDKVVNWKKDLDAADAFHRSQESQFGIPILASRIQRTTIGYNLVPSDTTQADPTKNRFVEISAMSGMQDHVRIVDGRFPSGQPVNGVYEVAVTEEVLGNLRLVLGNEFTVEDKEVKTPIRFKPVGVIDRSDYNDVYWSSNLTGYDATFFMDYDLFEREITTTGKMNIIYSTWYKALDYSQLKLERLTQFTNTVAGLEAYTKNYFGSHFNNTVKAASVPIINTYYDKEKQLRQMLWSLNLPVIILLAFYLFMVANLITERQKTEIAVLRSRGASRLQIVFSYLVEGVLLGAVAFAIGPLVGLQLTKILGAANGFMQFVQRAAIDAKLNEEAYRYSLIAVLASVTMTLIPVLNATRASIVGHKASMARQLKMSFLHKSFLDVLLMGVSIYLLFSFHRRMEDLVALGLDAKDLKIDPLLFLVPALFMLSMGLLLLRVYPFFLRLVYLIGRRWWPPYLYSALLQVGRSATQYQFIMVFLILTLATGLYSSSAARTMNQNIEDTLRYKNGADIALQTKWENDAPPTDMEMGGAGAAISTTPKKIQYTEPPFLPYTQLPGVEAAARVFSKKDAVLTVGKETTAIQLMGIDTDDFGRTAWLRDQLLDHHFYEYLNLLGSDPKAVLISKSTADQYKVNVGDTIALSWSGIKQTSFQVYGIIDFWPSWNPNPPSNAALKTVTTGSGSSTANKAVPKVKLPMLIVGHLSYIQNNLALEPYGVWIKMKPDGTSKELYAAMEEKMMPIVGLTDTRQQLIAARNDPFNLAINGVMTLGFLIGIGISFIGFLLYWVLSLYGRILQFGVFRAMGLSFRQIIGMLGAEQLLTSGAAVLIGAVTGTLTSSLFVPFFQLTFDPSTQVPPFRVTFHWLDRVNLYSIVGVMIVIGLFIIGFMLSRIKIHQAVKLGED
ncbi:ABC transporter permease [Paenibacillus koleovorans]|uniref:ABC transporter permease n=1 Tax=Paenibacillus koleovorans TaxID=121608 RepID=UPI000FDBB8F1|nr:ABC transporter permease [Paenibacillus koleovorans]